MMSIARNVEVSAQSSKGLEDAIQSAISDASDTLRGIKQFWVKDVIAEVENDKVVNWRVHGKLTFLVERGK
jgi:flavin-binding protein dodecin